MSVAVWMAVAARLQWMSDFDAVSRVCPGIQRSERLWKQKHGLVEEDGYSRCMYKDGKRHGLYEAWYSDGTRESRWMYKTGRYHGLCENYSNSTLYIRLMYKDGQLHGLCTGWHSDGTLECLWEYKNGNLHSAYWIGDL
jgi:hypothetical protein